MAFSDGKLDNSVASKDGGDILYDMQLCPQTSEMMACFVLIRL